MTSVFPGTPYITNLWVNPKGTSIMTPRDHLYNCIYKSSTLIVTSPYRTSGLLMSTGNPCVCQYIHVFIRDPYICCIPCVQGFCPWKYRPITLSRSVPTFSHGKFIQWIFILCSVFLIMSPVTATTTVPHMTALYSRALTNHFHLLL